ncbi:MAG TPA: hypothetical protein VGI70_01150 [Polyangiales bacterium]
MFRFHFIVAFVVCTIALRARADGEQLMPGGAQSVARGGANAARPSDVSTMLTNPAGLTDLESQALYDFDTAFNSICVHPYGYYGWGVYQPDDRGGSASNPDAHRSQFGDPTSSAYGQRHLDTVCNSAGIAPLPQLAFALKLSDRFSAAFGLVAPVLISGEQFGGKDGTIAVDNGSASRPTPTRYELIRQQTRFALDPTIAVGFRALPWLSFGLTLQVEMASLDNYLAMALSAGTSPSDDLLAKMHVSDFFIPAVTFAAYAKPTRWLSLAGTFMWSDGFDGHGDLTMTTNTYHRNGAGDELIPLQNDPVKLKRVRVPVPWTATLAARFSRPRSDDAHADYMTRDAWDVEADATFTANHQMGSNKVEIADNFSLEFRRANAAPQMPLMVSQSDLQQLNVERHVRSTVALRLGGSYNVLPGRVQVSAGGFFQTRGAAADYVSVTNFGLTRVGVGLGVTIRLGRVDLMAAYAHIFQETFDEAPPNPQPRTAATDNPKSGFDQRIYQDGVLSDVPKTDPRAPAPRAADGVAASQQSAVFTSDAMRARVINAGSYVVSFNVLSIGLVHHF